LPDLLKQHAAIALVLDTQSHFASISVSISQGQN